MVPPKQNSTASATFSDHEVITPENKLRKAVSIKPLRPAKTIRSRARKRRWRTCRRNSRPGWTPNANGWTRARRRIAAEGFTAAAKEALFHAAHDIKGEAATFGFPLVAPAAESLCRLIEHTPDVTRIPVKLVDQHVDAVRAIYREYSRSDAKDLATTLTKRLRAVADEFLVRENRDRPDVLEQIKGSSRAPE